MLKSIISYFFGGYEETELSLDEAYNILNSCAENTTDTTTVKHAEPEDTSFSTRHLTGFITSVKRTTYMIDGLYEFESTDLAIPVGSKVSYIAYVDKGKVQITNVVMITSDWDSIQESEGRKWCIRSVACKVVKRKERQVIVHPGDFSLDLNSVKSDFVPIVGDWLLVDVKSEIDEDVVDLGGKILNVEGIRPLRFKTLQGIVRDWDSIKGCGTIDRNVYFNTESLISGYVPQTADKIVAEVIESEQGRCCWRAINVVPEYQKSIKENVIVSAVEAFEDNVPGVYISNNINLELLRLNEIKKFELHINHTLKEGLVLKEVQCAQANGQCTLETQVDNLRIRPKANVKIEFKCRAKNIGISRELLLFVFENFKIGRWITVSLTTTVNPSSFMGQGSYQSRQYGGRRCNDVEQDVLRGERPIMPPRFISHKLPEYPVPKKLWDMVLNHSDSAKDVIFISEELHRLKPCLASLSFTSYEDYFHTLIHVEEIANIMAMRVYDQERACFIRNNEFLMLEIENLSERRPSVMIGDKIIAKDAYNPSGMNLEGYVHKVGAKHVYLKFNQMFHDTYKGEDYSITAVASRTSFKKIHQAVGLVVRNLGKDFLFPSRIQLREPQFMFTYDHYEDNLSTISENTKNQNPLLKETPNKHKQVLNSILKHINTTNPEFENNTQDDNKKSKLLLENTDSNIKNARNARPLKYEKGKTVHKLEWFDNSLNFYQKEAVRNILLGEARPLPYIIFGPPGTGKTVTLIETILQLLRLMPEARILVGTPSNSAADLIAIRLIDSGAIKPGDLVRYVAYRCVVENTIPVKLIPYCATGELSKEGTHARTHVTNANGLTLGINSSVIGRHRITVSTCSNLGTLYNMGFPRGHFTHIVIDEAGQLTEPEAMIPLALMDVTSGQAVLAGDPMQLGASLISRVASDNGLRESFLERLLNRFPYTRDPTGFPKSNGYDPRLVTKLVYNYRSLPEILHLSSTMFYNSELRPTISPLNSEEASLLNKIKEILPHRKGKEPPAMVFHGVEGDNFQTPDSPSWFNPQEASQIFFYVNELYRLGASVEDIGIISPYSKQVQQIRAILSEAEFDIPKIGTVEEFQGQEFNIVLLSVVRSSVNLIDSDVSHNIGFIASPRRLNVALTRAQALLIIIGNPNVLYSDPLWRNVLKYCVQNGAYCGCEINVN